MKKISTLKRGALTSSAFLTLFCSGGAFAQEQTYVLRLGSPTLNDTVHHWMKAFKVGVEKRASTRIRVELYPASQLGPTARQIEAVQLGTQEMFSAPPEFLAGIDKRYMLISAPLLFKDIEHGFRTVQDPAFSKIINDFGMQKGIKRLSMFCADPTSYVFSKPIKTVRDFGARKIRIFSSDMERETLRKLNATGVPMSLGEVLPALQQGVVEGARTTVSIFTAFKFYGSAKYLVKTEEAMVCPLQFVNRQWFDSLPKDLQSILLEEAKLADIDTHEFAFKFLNENYKKWVENGGEIAQFSGSEREDFLKKMSEVGTTVTATDPALKNAYSEIKAIAERQKNNPTPIR